jgi:hypothetical protein
VFDYVLLGRYPHEEDLQAVKLGQAASPIGKPREVASVNVLGVSDPSAGAAGVAPASLFTPSGAPQAPPKPLQAAVSGQPPGGLVPSAPAARPAR